jgi:antitoxin (DNA-binding transcriptional repressor) of toxin-antitoxin stability system
MMTAPHDDPVAMTPDASSQGRRAAWLLGGGAVLLVVLFHVLAVIRDFGGPIGDYNESFLHEYLAWYASKHLTFWPLPHLALHNDTILYPFGANGALQSWCAERDILFALLKPLFPRAPLLQLYYLLGVVASSLGTFLLLRRRHGDVRAALTAVLIHAFNFYAMQKYAYHYNIACCHWATLGIVCDFAIAEELVAERHVRLRLLLLRVLLVALAFGLELGHVLGFALTSALLTGLFVLGYGIREAWTGRLRARDCWDRWRAEGRAHRGQIIFLVAGIAIVSWLYGSVVVGIVRDSMELAQVEAKAVAWWASPLRLFIPYTPWLHPSMQPQLLHVRGDNAEVGMGGGGAGLFLLALAAIGLFQARRRLLAYLPLLLGFALYVASSPSLPLLRVLPWFSFLRVYQRSTVVYTAILALLAIDVSLARLGPRLRAAAWTVLCAVAALELTTLVIIKRHHPAYAFSPAQLAYLDTVKKLPGEAVLDFPFCIIGGNGDVGAGLCPFWERLKGVFALQRFHEKKVIGQYMGRLHPSQVKPFVEQGWAWMNAPDDPDISRANRQRRCLRPVEWELVEQFFVLNDFAAIQLAVDRLPLGCAEQFRARFGQPIATMKLAGAGRLELIPKKPQWRGRVDRARGKQLRARFTIPDDVELVQRAIPGDIRLHNFWSVESDGSRAWRWVFPPARVVFWVAEPREVELVARFQVHFGGVDVGITVDDAPVARWVELKRRPEATRTARFRLAAGRHVMVLSIRRPGPWPRDLPDSGPSLELRSLRLRALR